MHNYYYTVQNIIFFILYLILLKIREAALSYNTTDIF